MNDMSNTAGVDIMPKQTIATFLMWQFFKMLRSNDKMHSLLEIVYEEDERARKNDAVLADSVRLVFTQETANRISKSSFTSTTKQTIDTIESFLKQWLLEIYFTTITDSREEHLPNEWWAMMWKHIDGALIVCMVLESESIHSYLQSDKEGGGRKTPTIETLSEELLLMNRLLTRAVFFVDGVRKDVSEYRNQMKDSHIVKTLYARF